MKCWTKLIRILTLLILTTAISGANEKVQWLIHPGDSDVDKSFVGSSVFDEITKDIGGIPFPFELLKKRITQNIGVHKENSTFQIMIPIGRSLQREAAAPNYYLYPRQLLTFVGETATHVLTNRLFIAYQEASQQLEVISYNDVAGRFEFQVVEDYAKLKTPQVSQAPRALCMSCHQNGAPIFSKAPWSETNFGMAVARKLSNANPVRYPSPLDAISNDSIMFDKLTNDANYLSAVDFVWRSACGSSNACRSAIFRAAIQYRLNRELDFDRLNNYYQMNVVEHTKSRWRKNWPQGLLFPSADLVDHNPLINTALIAEQNPTFPRPAMAHWKEPNERFLQGIVQRLSANLATSAITDLEQILSDISKTQSFETQVYQTICSGKRGSTKDTHIVAKISCDNETVIYLEKETNLMLSKVQQVTLDNLKVGSVYSAWKYALRDIQSRNSESVRTITAKFANIDNGLSPRLASGNKLKSIGIEMNNHTSQVLVKLEVIKDFDSVNKAILELQKDPESKVFNAVPFEGSKIMRELKYKLLSLNH